MTFLHIYKAHATHTASCNRHARECDTDSYMRAHEHAHTSARARAHTAKFLKLLPGVVVQSTYTPPADLKLKSCTRSNHPEHLPAPRRWIAGRKNPHKAAERAAEAARKDVTQ